MQGAFKKRRSHYEHTAWIRMRAFIYHNIYKNDFLLKKFAASARKESAECLINIVIK